MKIQLSEGELAKITKPIKGQGGFQTLLRRIQKQIQGNILEASDADVETDPLLVRVRTGRLPGAGEDGRGFRDSVTRATTFNYE